MRWVSRRLVVLVCALVLASGVVAGCLPQTWVGWQYTPVRGYSELTPQQMAHYVDAVYWNSGGTVCSGLPYRATVSPLALALYFYDEGQAQYIRSDIAWAQSILETGWFSFCGSVPPGANNFAGIGATGSAGGCAPVPGDICSFSHPALGVRAQMQRLNRYANPADASSLARPLVPQRGWANATQYNHWTSWQGTKTIWQSLTGVWAASPCYDYRVLKLYNQMRTHYGLSPMPVAGSATC